MTEVSRSEYCAVAIADCFADDGEIMGSPMGLLPSLGARLAKLTSNPLLMLTDGEARILQGAPPLGVTEDVVEGWMPFRLVLESVVPYGKRHVMMGATQIDRAGNQNISAIGDWARPTRMLLGVRGRCRFRDRSIRNWVVADRTTHSAKPEVVRDYVTRVSPGRYLELFARQATPGWTVFGDQIEPSLFGIALDGQEGETSCETRG